MSDSLCFGVGEKENLWNGLCWLVCIVRYLPDLFRSMFFSFSFFPSGQYIFLVGGFSYLNGITLACFLDPCF
uniref:Uncharacterized protein n=1 Tax=Anguilla anguilla TaxID=7936 RepID=A0A0E9WVQ9_ANGAN